MTTVPMREDWSDLNLILSRLLILCQRLDRLLIMIDLS